MQDNELSKAWVVHVGFSVRHHHAAQLNSSSEPSTSASLMTKTIDAMLAYLSQNFDKEFQILVINCMI